MSNPVMLYLQYISTSPRNQIIMRPTGVWIQSLHSYQRCVEFIKSGEIYGEVQGTEAQGFWSSMLLSSVPWECIVQNDKGFYDQIADAQLK